MTTPDLRGYQQPTYYSQAATDDDTGRPVDYFGIKSGGRDNTAAVENGLIPYLYDRSRLGTPGGGLVRWGTGVYDVPPFTGSLRALPQHTVFLGMNKGATELRLAAGSNGDFVTNHQSTGATDPTGKNLWLQNITLNGNKANQSSGTGRGVFLTCPTPGSEPAVDYSPDNHSTLFNVEIKNCRGDGAGNSGASEMRYVYCYARLNDGNGFAPNYDSWLGYSTAEKNGKHGYRIGFGSIGVDMCKAFYSGTVDVSSASAGGAGMYIVSAGSTGGVIVTNFRAQDNGTNGVYHEGGGGETGRWTTIHGLICDSNGWGRGGVLATPGTWVGLSIWDTQYMFVTGFISFDRVVDHGAGARVTQQNAINLNASGAGVGHHVYVTGLHGGMVASQDAAMGAAIKAFNITNVITSSVTMNGVATTS